MTRDVRVRVRRVVLRAATSPRTNRETFRAEILDSLQVRLGGGEPATTDMVEGGRNPIADLIADAVSSAVRRVVPGLHREE